MTTTRRCLVLGGSGHVGSSVCRTLARSGAEIVFTYFRRENEARALAEAIPGARSLQVDLRDMSAIDRLVEGVAKNWGGLDALVQCAGTAGDPSLYQTNGNSPAQRFLSITEMGWDQMMNTTARSTFAACKAAARFMKPGAQMVIVGSMDGVKSVPSPVHYAAGKGALRAMVQALAKALGEEKILVNMIAPGILEGGMASLLSDDLLKEYLKHCSLKRVGTFQEVAEWVAWLVMENTYITGQSILLDGGL
jgi:3-oxoacyl-[acyl-carrier protein] reductase